MDTGPLKRYAIQARRDFVEAVSQRAAKLGITASGIQDYEKRGDLLFLGTEVLPGSFEPALKQLRAEVSLFGFDQMIDQVAYTWFNRLVALRFMEVNGLLPIRVLSSSTENPYPDVLREFSKLSLAINFDPRHAQKLYEAGGKDEELYEYLLTAHCNELYRTMPFLFEMVSDSSEILLPDGLLSSDSIVRKLVEEVPEESWLGGVEIIGWLYQFYISEKKDEVIGSVVKSQDIPAATQLFTPNWIVKYLIQNSLGAYWLSANPDSPLRSRMEFYIEPAKQIPEVDAELKRITPSDIDPETITVLDPAVGSGHILVEAYNLLYDIYLERGYRAVDVPRLILEKNLFGLDIDKRASQLAGFALLMRAARDDSSILDPELPPKLNLLEIVEPEFKTEEAVQFLMKGKSVKIKQLNMPFAKAAAQAELPLEAPDELSPGNMAEFVDTFRDAKTFGSLIRVPLHLVKKFAGIDMVVRQGLRSTDLFERRYSEKILRLIEQAKVLSSQFDVVVANPPYMGTKFFPLPFKQWMTTNFPIGKADLFAAFILTARQLARENGYSALVTMQTWMFLSSFEELRSHLLETSRIESLIHLGSRAFGSISGEVVQTTAFIFRAEFVPNYTGKYIRLIEGDEEEKSSRLYNKDFPIFLCRQSDFFAVPGHPIAYWLSERMRQVFRDGISLGEIAEPRQGLATSDNARFLRRWFEVDHQKIGFGFASLESANSSSFKWFPYNKGGAFRKWFGNNDFVINWEQGGREVI